MTSTSVNNTTFVPTPVDFTLDGNPSNVCIRNKLGLIKRCLTVVNSEKDPSKAVLSNVRPFELPDQIVLEKTIEEENQKLLNRADACLDALKLKGGLTNALKLDPSSISGSLATVSNIDKSQIQQNVLFPMTIDDAKTSTSNIISSGELSRRLQIHEDKIVSLIEPEAKALYPTGFPWWDAPTNFPGVEPVVLSCRNMTKSFSPPGIGSTWHWRSNAGNYKKLYDNYNMSSNETSNFFTIPESGIYFLSYDENIAHQYTTTRQDFEDALPNKDQSLDPRNSVVAIDMVIAVGGDGPNLKNLQEECYYLPQRYQIFMTILSVCLVTYLEKGAQIRFGFKWNPPANFFSEVAIKTANIGGMHIAQLNCFPDQPV